ncbi:MAG: DUF1501 domain-containing protein [Planctomycetaceae bacterium]|nr:DUF1501 domain-containing protein [Planctomycetaceae bacterium]
MLTLLSGAMSAGCSFSTRRDFIRVGALGLGGLTLPWLLSHRAWAVEHDAVRDRAVVLLFLSGGASHIETFNPNMGAPSPYCSLTGAVQTSLPGVTFGGTFPQLARHAHEMAVVRSFQHSIGGHVEAIRHVLTGGTDPSGKGAAGFGMGAAYARLRGANHPRTGMPTSALLNTEEVDPQYRNEKDRVERGSAPNGLGSNYAPFIPDGKGDAVDNLTLNVSTDRLDDRRSLLTALDRFRRTSEATDAWAGVDKYTQQAFDVILGSTAEAFDLSRENPRLVERYDTSSFQVGKKVFRSSQLGRHMLTARRLIEAGCGFVTVHSAGWDMHADGNNPGIEAGMEMLGRPVDQAVSAFLDDLRERGLLDKVLLIITGDFGRTPTINSRGGRDHWPKLCTLALAGGGVNRGRIIGQSSRKNDEPLTEPVGPGQLLASVMHTLFDVGALRVRPDVPRELMQMIEQHAPIPDLLA